MKKNNDFSELDEVFERFFGAELDSLEGEQEAVELWQKLQNDPAARQRYDALVLALRAFGGRDGVKSFGEDEGEALWPVVMGFVSQGARQRSGLSKEALRHMAVPDLVSQITRALVSYNQKTVQPFEELVIESAVEPGVEAPPMNFSIASVGGEVSLRLYDNDNQDVELVANVSSEEVKTNVELPELDAWGEVSTALSTLRMMTAELLGDEVLVKGKIELKDGRARVSLSPIGVTTKAK